MAAVLGQAHSQGSSCQGPELRSLGVEQVYPTVGQNTRTDIDIFAIHGLDTKSPDTWIYKGDKDVNWLQSPHMLPEGVPNGRILTCNWPSQIYRNLKSIEMTISELAQGLLCDIQVNRREFGAAKNRPVMFIASCLGGLVLARALKIAADHGSGYEDLRNATAGIVFLATPFKGTSLADLFDVAMARLEFGGFGSDKALAKRLLDNIGESTADGDRLVWEFANSFSSPKCRPIYCFYEMQATDLVTKAFPKSWLPWIPWFLLKRIAHPKLLVKPDSACLQIAKENIPLDLNHLMMNKFSGPNDNNYKKVLDKVKTIVGSAPSFHTRSLGFSGEDKTCWDALTKRVPAAGEAIKSIEKRKEPLILECSQWIINRLNWPRGQDAPVVHVVGHPGTGKTMLMLTLIKSHDPQVEYGGTDHLPLSYFFFSSESSSATAFYRGLIYQLIRTNRNSDLIADLRDRGEDVFDEPLALGSVLESMLSRLKPALLFVDALDECQEQDLDEIFRCIHNTITASGTKWVISSRPNIVIKEKLKESHETKVEEIILTPNLLENHINHYIEIKVSNLTRVKEYNSDLRQKVLRKFQAKAGGTFLWVSLVCRIMERDYEACNDDQVLEHLRNMPEGLPKIYNLILSNILSFGSQPFQEGCIAILATTALAKRPLHLLELASLADPERKMEVAQVEKYLEICGNFFLLQEDMVYFIHPSARDFLQKDPGRKIFPSGESQKHYEIYLSSRKFISSLEPDIYHLKCPGININDITPPSPDPLLPWAYSCESWMDHLHDYAVTPHTGPCEALADGGKAMLFLSSSLLCWLECLSLLRKLSDGVLSIKKLLHVVQSQSDSSTELFRLLRDAEVFVLSYGSTVQRYPLQIYGTAFVFCPTNSLVKANFINQCKKQLDFIKAVAGIRDSWGPHLQTLECLRNGLDCIAFSPDGRTLITAGYDNIQRWDTATGALQQTLTIEGITWSDRVLMSPDGKALASMSWTPYNNYDTVRVWDTASGVCQWTCEDSASDMVFSLDGKTLVTVGSESIQRRNTATGILQQTIRIEELPNHIGADIPPWDVRAASYSIHYKGALQLWDLKTGLHWKALKDHQEPNGCWTTFSYVTFSPDGRTFAAASLDKAIYLWDIATGICQHIREGHRNRVCAFAFSPDNRMLASCSKDATILLWDTATGRRLQTLNMYTGFESDTFNIAFSPDGRMLASCTSNGPVQLWDITIAAHQQALKNVRGRINSVALSPDGKLVASGSEDSIIQIWNIATSAKQVLEGHRGPIKGVAFSPDSTILASSAEDYTIRFWDAATGIYQRTIKCSWAYATGIAFSPDGSILASGSEATNVVLYEVACGGHLHSFWGHGSSCWDVSFSPDGRILASVQSNRTILLWDMAKRKCLQTIETPQLNTKLKRLAFSDNGQYLETDQGSLEIDLHLGDSNKGVFRQPADGKVAVIDNWVMRGEKKLLFLPKDYQPTCMVIDHDTVVLGHMSGQVTFLQLIFS